MQELDTLVKDAIEAAGYTWEGQELENQGRGTALLRVFIDKEGGVTADDCALASRQLTTALKVEGLDEQYLLEVSSPGLDRRLFTTEQMQRYLNEEVKIRLYQAIEGRRKWFGALKAATPEEITLVAEDMEAPVVIPMSAVQWIRLVPQV
jgi:ribosome maturation factor RimP